MRQTDRILKGVYRERFIRLTKKELNNPFEEFSFSNKFFCEKLKIVYQNMYPENYSGDELDSVFYAKKEELLENYKSSNAIYLIPLYANKLFIIKNRQILVKYPSLLEWNGFQNKIDSNVFVSAFAASNNYGEILKDTNIVIKHDNEKLYKILNKGICEGHMHLKGSGQTTELSWNKILKNSFFNHSKIKNFIGNTNNFLKLKSYGYTEDDILLMILKLKLIRIILSELDVSEAPYIQKKELSFLIELLMQENLIDFMGEAQTHKNTLDNYIEKTSTEIEILEKKQGCLPDRLFYFKEFRKVLNNIYHEESDWLYMLNYYIWGASVLKFEFYQDNLGMGFQKFKYFENVKDDLIENNSLIYRSVFQRYYEEGNVKKIELRIAPKYSEDIQNMLKEIDNINEEVYKIYKNKNGDLEKIKVALIIHYIKIDELSTNEENIERGRFQKFVDKLEKDDKLVELTLFEEYKKCKANSNYQNRVVALDAANTELATPPEIFAPYFRKHRKNNTAFLDLHFTYHVGEEFKTLESGLRYIEDTINFLKYERGDRLGHALALGIDVEKYYKIKRYKVITNVQDYVDNIAWLYNLYANEKQMNSQFMSALQNRFYKTIPLLKLNTLDKDFTIEDYVQSLLLRGDSRAEYLSPNNYQSLNSYSTSDEIKFANYLEGYHIAINNAKAKWLHHKYLYDSQLIKNGMKSIQYEVDELWIEMICTTQEILTTKLIQKGIIVEANPSSNRKISSMSHYTELPFLKMNDHYLNSKSIQKNIAITINTDDSAIFQTNLSNEYSLVACALERDNYPVENVYKYIDYLRQASNDYIFF